MDADASLRSLLENEYQKNAFKADGIADVIVPTSDIDRRIAAMHRGLVAHAALNKLIEINGEAPRSHLGLAIAAALRLRLISRTESNILKDFNFEANEAKHALYPNGPMPDGEADGTVQGAAWYTDP